MPSFVTNHPAWTLSGLFLVAGLFRLLDIFVFRLDEKWGEILLSKLILSGMVIGYAFFSGAGWRSIGFLQTNLGISLMFGAGITLLAFALSYALEYGLSVQSGHHLQLRLSAIDPKSGLAGALGFGLFLLAGNAVNAFAEEGLFRGIMILALTRPYGIGVAVGASALVFALWHIPWAFKAQMTGQSSLWPALVVNFVPQLVMGIVWGILFWRTGNLWSVWTAHFLTNSVLNFVHFEDQSGMDSGLSLRMITYLIVMTVATAISSLNQG
mgnify:CR=1 FL=1